eukprot:363901-Chlamydomonas_euryale.AAC.34
MQVRNVPEDCSTDDVKAVIESAGATVRDVVFDGEAKEGKLVAIVRFTPLQPAWTLTKEQLDQPMLHPVPEPEPEAGEDIKGEDDKAEGGNADDAKADDDKADDDKADDNKAEDKEGEAADVKPEDAKPAGEHTDVKAKTEGGKDASKVEGGKKDAGTPGKGKGKDKPPRKQLEDGRKDGDALKTSRYLVWGLSDHKLELKGEKLQFDSPPQQVTLFLGDVTSEDEEALRADMEQYGQLERCFLMRNVDGSSKVCALHVRLRAHAFRHTDHEWVLCGGVAESGCVPAGRHTSHSWPLLTFCAAANMPVQPAAQGYAFVEFALASSATAAKEAIEVKFKAAFSDLTTKRATVARLRQALRALEEGREPPVPVPNLAAPSADGAAAEGGEGTAEEKPTDPVAKKAEMEAELAKLNAEETVGHKILRAELIHLRTIQSLFARSLYIANLPGGKYDDAELKALVEPYGPLSSVTVARHLNGNSKGFGFVEFSRSDHAASARGALEALSNPPYDKLSVSFQNPGKLMPQVRFGLACCFWWHRGRQGDWRRRGVQSRCVSTPSAQGASGQLHDVCTSVSGGSRCFASGRLPGQAQTYGG